MISAVCDFWRDLESAYKAQVKGEELVGALALRWRPVDRILQEVTENRKRRAQVPIVPDHWLFGAKSDASHLLSGLAREELIELSFVRRDQLHLTVDRPEFDLDAELRELITVHHDAVLALIDPEKAYPFYRKIGGSGGYKVDFGAPKVSYGQLAPAFVHARR